MNVRNQGGRWELSFTNKLLYRWERNTRTWSKSHNCSEMELGFKLSLSLSVKGCVLKMSVSPVMNRALDTQWTCKRVFSCPDNWEVLIIDSATSENTTGCELNRISYLMEAIFHTDNPAVFSVLDYSISWDIQTIIIDLPTWNRIPFSP